MAGTINRWRKGGNRSTRRKLLTTSFRKCHIPKPENSNPNRDLNPHSSSGGILGKQTCTPLHHASPQIISKTYMRETETYWSKTAKRRVRDSNKPRWQSVVSDTRHAMIPVTSRRPCCWLKNSELMLTTTLVCEGGSVVRSWLAGFSIRGATKTDIGSKHNAATWLLHQWSLISNHPPPPPQKKTSLWQQPPRKTWP